MILSIIVASQLLPAFHFKGGCDGDLLWALEASYRKPAIILASPDGGQWKKCDLKPADDKQHQRLLGSLLGLDANLPIDGGFAPIAWPWGFMHKSAEREYGPAFKTKVRALPTFKDGSLTLVTKGFEAVSIKDLEQLGLSKPLKAHPFFQTAFLRMSVHDVTESAFLKTLATALGATLTETKSEYFLDIDAHAYRLRALAAWKDELAHQKDPVSVADAEYMVALLDQIPERIIFNAFHKKNSMLQVGKAYPPGSNIYRLAYERVRVYLMATDSKNVQGLFDNVVDPRQPVWGIIDPTGSARSVFYNRENNRQVVF